MSQGLGFALVVRGEEMALWGELPKLRRAAARVRVGRRG